MEMDTYEDVNVQNVQVRSDALQNRPGKDVEVRVAAPGVRLFRLVAVTFGLLCILQAAVNISLRLVLYTEAGYKNLTEERDGLERKLETLVSQLNSLTAERDELMMTLRTLVSQLNSLTAERDELMMTLRTLDGWQRFGDRLYYISSTEKSWNESRSDCVEKGAHLMIINSKEEQEFTRQLTKSVWIGLTDAEREGTWKWVDGTPLTTSYWRNGEPNNEGQENEEEDCGIVDYPPPENNWNDRGCEEMSYWICEKTLAS